MTKFEYANQVATILGGEVMPVEKANGIILTGITVRGEGNISPTVYIDQPYEDGLSVEEAARELKKAIDNAALQTPPCDTSVFMNYEKVKPLLRARLYNRKTNAEVFKSAEEYGFDDLIIIPYVQLNENASAKVTRKLADTWGG